MSDLTCIYLKCWPIIKISKIFNVKKKITYSVCAYKYERWRRGILFEKNISFPLYIIFFLEISIFLSSLENWKIINKSSWSSICTSRTIAVIYDRFILNTSQFLSKIHWDRFFFLFFFMRHERCGSKAVEQAFFKRGICNQNGHVSSNQKWF